LADLSGSQYLIRLRHRATLDICATEC